MTDNDLMGLAIGNAETRVSAENADKEDDIAEKELDEESQSEQKENDNEEPKQSENRKNETKNVKKVTKKLIKNKDFQTKLEFLISEALTNSSEGDTSDGVDAFILEKIKEIANKKLKKRNQPRILIRGEDPVEGTRYQSLSDPSSTFKPVNEKPKGVPLKEEDFTKDDVKALIQLLVQKDDDGLLRPHYQLKRSKDEKQRKNIKEDLEREELMEKIKQVILEEIENLYGEADVSDVQTVDDSHEVIRMLVREELQQKTQEKKDACNSELVYKQKRKEELKNKKKLEEILKQVLDQMAIKKDSEFPLQNQNEDGNRSWSKVTSQGLLDVSLLIANASQLRVLLATPRQSWEGFFYVLMCLLCVSICSQVVLGVLLVLSLHIKGKPTKNEGDDTAKTAVTEGNAKKHRKRRNRIKAAIMLMSFFLTVTNILITSFGFTFIEKAKC